MSGADRCRGARLAVWWVRCYTRGLPSEVRERRRAEVASDVFEHQTAEHHARGVSVAIAGRTLRGTMADLAWRRATQRAIRRDGPQPARPGFLRSAWATVTQAWFTPLAVLVGFFDLLLGLGILLDDESTMPGRVVGPVFLIAAAMAMGVGLHRRRTTQLLVEVRPTIHANDPRRMLRFAAGTAGVLVTIAGFVFGVTVGGGFAVAASVAAGLALVVAAAITRRPRGGHAGDLARPTSVARPRSGRFSDGLIVLGSLPAFAMFWMIVPTVLAVAVISGVFGTGPGTRVASR